eukprot:15476672-Alexandrium_andersonii.AAC.1
MALRPWRAQQHRGSVRPCSLGTAPAKRLYHGQTCPARLPGNRCVVVAERQENQRRSLEAFRLEGHDEG